MRVNWAQGFSRLSYAVLAAGCLVALLAAIFSGPEKMAGWIVGGFIYAAVWFALHRGIAWIARGFSGRADTPLQR